MYRLIKRNQRRLRVFLVGFVLFCALPGILIGILLQAWQTSVGLTVVAVLFVVLEYFQSTQRLLRVSGARELDPRIESHVGFQRVADNVAITAGIRTPALRVVDSPTPNAFSLGRTQDSAVIVVTQGLLELLSQNELEGVVAHEIAHIQHDDTRVSTVVAALVTFGGRVSANLSGEDAAPRSGSSYSGEVISQTLAALIRFFCGLFRFAISQERELLADAAAIQLTRFPEGLASALQTLTDHQTGESGDEAGTQHLWIVPPRLAEGTDKRSASHPSLDERLRKLEKAGSSF